jgi:nucleoside phosphorylase
MPKCADIPKALIFTAIPVEYLAIRTYLSEIEEKEHDLGTIYERGRYKGTRHEWEVWIVQTGPGSEYAAAEVERGLQYIRPEVTFFVGVAGGIKDVNLGDVVIATKVYSYEGGKAKETFEPRPDLYNASYRLLQRAKALAHADNWFSVAIDKQKPVPRVFLGPIATGEKVIASKKSSVYSLLKGSYGDALAVDMESHGHMLSAHAHEAPALVVRGISDLLSNKRSADKAGWQNLAAANAAAFMFSVLSNIDKSNLKTDTPTEQFISWETIHSILNTLYREIERNFAPDLVITMSGPGGFAACYCMGLNPRDIPVLFATTFPRREEPSSSHSMFRQVAEIGGWLPLSTEKWDVYLPNAITLLPPNSKILIFDDRVITGETQRKLKLELKRYGYDVRCAAMLASDDVADQLDFIGSRVNNDYIMPWGRKRGRT